MSETLTFERLDIGGEIGVATDRIDAAMLAHWRTIYPGDTSSAGRVPAGMTAALIMRAYLKVVAPRPAGNIHVGLDIKSYDNARIDELTSTTVTCAMKELKRDRRYIDFDTQTHGEDGRSLFTGRLRLIWAA